MINIERELNNAQRKRIEDHQPSVKVDKDGNFEVRSELINISGKGKKVNNIISILPDANETVTQMGPDTDYLFRDLSHMNVILTNACNLSCTYCYEQHNKDYGRFTVESLKKSYDWLNKQNNREKKNFQFFGGEPLIHKQLIRDFIAEYDEELSQNYDNYHGTYISMCTNGLLLDDEFIEYYFNRPYTHMLISLDTFNTTLDHREIAPWQLKRIVESVKKIINTIDDPMRLVIRTTLSQETAPEMKEFIAGLYDAGVRSIIVHPLVLDSRRGYIDWDEKVWNGMRDDIFEALDKWEDLYIKFSEGVGEKDNNNCLIGSDMIAIDASGDFSGCYFFTNHKGGGAEHTLLGNIHKEVVYLDRYKAFQKAYSEMFEIEEQCKSCDLQSMCYQCPAGNIDTGPRLFRPDNMCQKIVRMYLDFQQDVAKKTFWRRVNKINNDLEHIPNHIDTSIETLYKHYHNEPSKYKTYKAILAEWAKNITTVVENELELDQFFKIFGRRHGIVSDLPQVNEVNFVKAYYIQCISMIVYDREVNPEKFSTLLA